MKEAIAEVQKCLHEARTLAGSGKLQEALDQANAAVEKAEALESDEPVVFEARGAAYAELGLLLQRAGDARRALDAYLTAEKTVRQLPYQEGKPHYRLLVATTVINLAGLYTKQRRLDDASERITEAIALLESAESAGPATKVLMVGALQNRAAIETEQKDMEGAEKTLHRAMVIGEELVTSAPQLLPQLVEVSGRLASVLRNRGRTNEALAIAEKSARWAEAAHGAGSRLGVPLYVSTQLQLVDANFAAKRFAQAEDHLWKAVEVAPGPQTMLVGTGFYCSLLRMGESALSSGDLPYDEVVEALSELLEKIEAANPPATLLSLVRARYAVLVERGSEAGEAALVSSSEDASPVVRQLSAALSDDLKWLKTQREMGSDEK